MTHATPLWPRWEALPLASLAQVTDLTPAWQPTADVIAGSNLMGFMRDLGMDEYAELYDFSIAQRDTFWEAVIERLGIEFRTTYESVLGASGDAENPVWLEGARLNIVDSCFHGDPTATAVIYRQAGVNRTMTYEELRAAVKKAASGLTNAGFGSGDRIAIAMPMTIESVVAYLAVVAIGGVVVSIADSFAPNEIETRLRVTGVTTVITQDIVTRGGKWLPMYAKVVEAGAKRAIVVDTGGELQLRERDLSWARVAAADGEFEPVASGPDAHINILFSSGTTGEPKAIPWTQLTPIKAAMDGHFHQDIHASDVVAWPTNLGWMMGPWLIFSSLINRAALALYDDVPTGEGFATFVKEAGVTILGVVPSMVAAWRSNGAVEASDWSKVRLFSSTGEASNAEDMAYLMGLAGPKPVIEYCGGTEIGGGYITGTVLQSAVPATFTTPTLGLELRILDADGEAADEGEVFIVPPSIGLSSELLNKDHHEVYYAGTPSGDVTLRRHGDHMEALPGGYYRAHGRVDDTMNLGGIKVSSAEIEQAIQGSPDVAETAAIAVTAEGGGPSRLIIYAVPVEGAKPDPVQLRTAMQQAIRSELNPLFKIEDVILIDVLPRTASAKVMRRNLRAGYRHASEEQ